ncbi:MAG: hypothetical protein DHS20C11_32170 [Lysobacteraceae bacterium]|nr:MAG: hypothetical protein DHS20C11_32170 [Xanthomonadaceae bacterium]
MKQRSQFHLWREQFRQGLPSWYDGRLHLLGTVVLALAMITTACVMMVGVTAVELLTIPLTLIYVNLFEYVGHRWVMHRRVRFLSRVHRRHTLEHHRFFDHNNMAVDHHRDYYAVLFAPVLVLFFGAVFVLPGWLLLAMLFSSNVAWLFTATIFAYFLNYELLHLTYHQPWCQKVPVLESLARHHRVHHDPTLMRYCNFNVTYPLADWLFNTLQRSQYDNHNEH